MQSNRYLPAEATPASVGLMGKERFLPLLKSSDYELQSLKWLTLPHSNKRTPVQSQLNFLLNSLLSPTIPLTTWSLYVTATALLAPGLPLKLRVSVQVSASLCAVRSGPPPTQIGHLTSSNTKTISRDYTLAQMPSCKYSLYLFCHFPAIP